MDFQKAIQYVPTEVKYYLSRARTYYFMEDLEHAQIDICICILLEPTNQEIPKKEKPQHLCVCVYVCSYCACVKVCVKVYERSCVSERWGR